MGTFAQRADGFFPAERTLVGHDVFRGAAVDAERDGPRLVRAERPMSREHEGLGELGAVVEPTRGGVAVRRKRPAGVIKLIDTLELVLVTGT